jgi:hypothetical protein
MAGVGIGEGSINSNELHTHTHIKGAVDLANGWTANSRYRHIATRINFLRELREEHIISVYWITNKLMTSNIFTKNVGG